MKRSRRQIIAAAALLAVWLASAADASACSACFGKSNDAMFFSYYVGAFTLIGVVLVVFAGIVSFAIHMNRRAAQSNAGLSALEGAPEPSATAK